MKTLIHSNALKHGIEPEQIDWAVQMAAVEVRVRERDINAEPPRWAVIGIDSAGRVLELVAVALPGDVAMIIHANYLTPGFEKEMREAR